MGREKEVGVKSSSCAIRVVIELSKVYAVRRSCPYPTYLSLVASAVLYAARIRRGKQMIAGPLCSYSRKQCVMFTLGRYRYVFE